MLEGLRGEVEGGAALTSRCGLGCCVQVDGCRAHAVGIRLERCSRYLDGEGDFFHIPPRLVHRDMNPDKEQELVVVTNLVGRGEPVINVKSPKQA